MKEDLIIDMNMDTKRAIAQLKALQRAGKSLRLAAEWNKPWQSLISTILSARTTDVKTIEVSNKLYNKYNNIEKLACGKYADVARIVKPVNFYKTKTKNIIACAKMIVYSYNGIVPRDFEKLVELPGVGRKTANVFLAHQGGAHIGVDTHVSYISQKMGWTKHTKPHLIEEDLEKLFPKKYWRDINYILVRFGQSYKSRKEKNAILDKIKKIK
ncbi:MAG: endonuclease III [archaeon]|nr:endonuclease III [archaeon]